LTRNAAHISIVDDDESVRTALTSLVRSAGFSATGFSSVEEFLASPTLRDTACVICDIQMPRVSGLELQASLTAQHIRTPVILITAYPDPRLEQQAVRAGAVCLLKKPFDGDVLLECLTRTLTKPSA